MFQGREDGIFCTKSLRRKLVHECVPGLLVEIEASPQQQPTNNIYSFNA